MHLWLLCSVYCDTKPDQECLYNYFTLWISPHSLREKVIYWENTLKSLSPSPTFLPYSAILSSHLYRILTCSTCGVLGVNRSSLIMMSSTLHHQALCRHISKAYHLHILFCLLLVLSFLISFWHTINESMWKLCDAKPTTRQDEKKIYIAILELFYIGGKSRKKVGSDDSGSHSQSFRLLERVPSLLQKLKLKSVSIQIELESPLEFNISNMSFS